MPRRHTNRSEDYRSELDCIMDDVLEEALFDAEDWPDPDENPYGLGTTLGCDIDAALGNVQAVVT